MIIIIWTQHIHACEQAMTHRMQQTSKVMNLERRQQVLHACIHIDYIHM